MNRVRAGAWLLLGSACVVGCGLVFDFGDYDSSRTAASSEGGPFDEAGVVPPDSFLLSVDPTLVSGTTDEPTRIVLRVRRGERFKGEVSFLPLEGDGVLDAPPIPPEATESIAFVKPGAIHGLREVTIVGKSLGEVTAKAVLRIDVRGRPGTLDTTFGANGIVELPAIAAARDVLVTDDDRVVIATREVAFGTARDALTLARLTQVGALDAAFGTGGRALVVAANGGEADGTQCVARGPTPGSLLVAGTNGAKKHLHLAATDSTGKPITTFGAAGTGDIVIGTAECKSLSVLADGALLVGASTFVQKRKSNGEPDPTWADAGEVPFDGTGESLTGALPEGAEIRAYANDTFGSWLIGADGTRGPKTVNTNVPREGCVARARPATLPDGRVLVGGNCGTFSTGGGERVPVIGLLTAGTATNDFPEKGFVTGPNTGETSAVVFASGGFVRVSGTNNDERVLVVRYDKGGSSTWTFDPSALPALEATRTSAAAADSRGRVVIVGTRALPSGETRAVALRLWN